MRVKLTTTSCDNHVIVPGFQVRKCGFCKKVVVLHQVQCFKKMKKNEYRIRTGWLVVAILLIKTRMVLSEKLENRLEFSAAPNEQPRSVYGIPKQFRETSDKQG